MSHSPKQGRNYYENLGLVRTATAKEIERAFRQLASQWHPDVCSDIGEAAENFKAISEAYEVLGDPKKRREYDRVHWPTRRRPSSTPRSRPPTDIPTSRPPHVVGTGWFPEDLVELVWTMFAGRPVSQPERQRNRARSDLNIEAELPITPEEARYGGSVQFQLSLPLRCPDCDGRGGSCRRCTGAGSVRQDPRSLSVRVPPGACTGTVIRVPGQGKSDLNAVGDLLLKVRVQPYC